MESREPDSKHGRQVVEIDLTTKEWKEEWMRPSPQNVARSSIKKTRAKQARYTPFLPTESGHPQEHTREKRTAMEIVS
eukprot:6142940-Heterocapsa_arctica.AAC.1